MDKLIRVYERYVQWPILGMITLWLLYQIGSIIVV